jgi:hypothetical protein
MRQRILSGWVGLAMLLALFLAMGSLPTAFASVTVMGAQVTQNISATCHRPEPEAPTQLGLAGSASIESMKP